MVGTSCLAGIDDGEVSLLGGVVRGVGASISPSTARLNVTELGKMAPGLIVCDIDKLEVDPLEMVRQLRFVLPDCIIAVYTKSKTQRWARAVHMAGANCLLSKDSNRAQLVLGLRSALTSGCFTDPGVATDPLGRRHVRDRGSTSPRRSR
jgi:DNA-binding NarL/FixJ family response regulator